MPRRGPVVVPIMGTYTVAEVRTHRGSSMQDRPRLSGDRDLYRGGGGVRGPKEVCVPQIDLQF